MILRNGMELLIEKAVQKDADKLIAYLNTVGGESDNLLIGENEFPMNVEQEENFISKINSSECSALFVGKIKNDITCVGSIQSPDKARISHQSDIAVSVKKAYWNMGIGTELLKTLIEFAKRTNKIEIIHLGVKSDNDNAIELYTKMGFIKIGLYEKFFKINGIYYDEILMNLYL